MDSTPVLPVIELEASVEGEALLRAAVYPNDFYVLFDNSFEKNFLTVLDRFSSSTLNTLLPSRNEKGWTHLHTICRYQGNRALLALLAKVSSDVIDITLLMQNDEKETPLNLACQYQLGAACQALIQKASSHAIDSELLLQNKQGWTSLTTAARYQPEEVFLALLDKGSPDAISAALALPHQVGSSTLGIVARYQSEKALLALINKASEAVVTGAFLVQNPSLSTAGVAARFLAPRAFASLLKKLEPGTLRKVFEARRGFLRTVVSWQDSSNFYAVIDGLKTEELSELFSSIVRATKDLNDINLFYKSLTKHLFYRANETVLKSVAPYFSKLYPYFLKKLPSSAALTAVMISYMLKQDVTVLTSKEVTILRKYQKENEPAKNAYTRYLNSEIRKWLLLQKRSPEELAHVDSLSVIEMLTFMQEQEIDLPESMKNEISFYNRIDEKLLQCHSNREISTVEFSFFRKKHRENTAQTTVEEVVASHQGLIKIVRPCYWEDILKQLKDYTYRPSLRLEVGGPFKYVHLTGEITPVVPTEKKLVYESTRKSSSTLLSPSLKTRVAGYNSAYPLVGLLFDNRRCTVKAMFRHDADTFCKRWVSSFNFVRGYACTVQRHVFKDRDRFREVTASDQLVNEVLANYTRESLVALVVVARDNVSTGYGIAKIYAAQVKSELGIDLPIYEYDYVYGLFEDVSETVNTFPTKCTM